MIQQMLEKMDEGERDFVAKMVVHEIAKLPDTPSLKDLVSFYGKLDSAIQDCIADASNIRCARGCSFCCRINLDVTHPEALALLPFINESDKRLIEVQASMRWSQLRPKYQRCVFLENDGSCRVYALRPIACRKYFVASSPKFCDTQNRPGSIVKVVSLTKPEIFANAWFMKYGNKSNLPSRLFSIIQNT